MVDKQSSSFTAARNSQQNCTIITSSHFFSLLHRQSARWRYLIASREGKKKCPTSEQHQEHPFLLWQGNLKALKALPERRKNTIFFFFFFSTAPNFRHPPDKPRLGEDYSMEPVRAGRAGVAVEMVTAGCFWALKSASAPNHSRKGPFLTPNCRDTLRMPLFGSWWPELFAQSTNQISFVQSYKKKNPTPSKIPEKLVYCTFVLPGCKQQRKTLKNGLLSCCFW